MSITTVLVRKEFRREKEEIRKAEEAKALQEQKGAEELKKQEEVKQLLNLKPEQAEGDVKSEEEAKERVVGRTFVESVLLCCNGQ